MSVADNRWKENESWTKVSLCSDAAGGPQNVAE